MQVNRLFEMLYILLEKQSVTARELAERFEVSTRTVYRDLETLSAAGIPVYAAKGRGGGIRILPGFVLDKSMLSGEEQRGILSALQGLGAAGDSEAAQMLDKMSSLFQKREEPWIAVDFSGWGQGRDLFDLLKGAVQEKRVVRFTYYGSNGERTGRTTEPLQLYFKGGSWYLRAFCRDKQGLRLFRFSRIRNPEITGEQFERTWKPEEDLAEQQTWNQSGLVTVRLRIDASHAYRVRDEFEPEDVMAEPDGSYRVQMRSPVDQWLVGFVLSFGGAARVIEPESLARNVYRTAQDILRKYENL